MITTATEEKHLSIYLLDSITGSTIYTTTIENAVEPVHSTIVDNWLSVSYWSSKHRRFELESIELYRGKAQTRSHMNLFRILEFSSLVSDIASRDIRVIRQGYVLPFEPGKFFFSQVYFRKSTLFYF